MFSTHHAIQLRVDQDAPAAARDFVRRWCRTHRRGDTDLVLATSELVSLVMRSDIDARLGVRVAPLDGGVLLSVTAFCRMSSEPDSHACDVLEQLAERWDIEASQSGLRAWAVIMTAPAEEH